MRRERLLGARLWCVQYYHTFPFAGASFWADAIEILSRFPIPLCTHTHTHTPLSTPGHPGKGVLRADGGAPDGADIFPGDPGGVQ